MGWDGMGLGVEPSRVELAGLWVIERGKGIKEGGKEEAGVEESAAK